MAATTFRSPTLAVDLQREREVGDSVRTIRAECSTFVAFPNSIPTFTFDDPTVDSNEKTANKEEELPVVNVGFEADDEGFYGV